MRPFSRCHLAVLAAVCVLGTAPALAQNVSFEAQVDKNPVGVGEQFTLSLVLNNPGSGGGKNLRLPDLSAFQILSGPSQSTSMQIINSVVTSSVITTYILQAREAGKFTIGSASIEVGGNLLSTKAITMEVVRGQTQPSARSGGGAGQTTAASSDNIFLRAVVDKARVVQGEQVNVSFRLYTRIPVINYAVEKNPALTGFWSEDIETPKNITLSREVVNGKEYQVGTIRRMALFPTQAGSLEIAPMELQATIQDRSQRVLDPFDAFFRDPFGRNVNVRVASVPLKISVEALPGGAPAEFRGAVGQFAMSATADKRTTRTNEPVSFKITISGTGNIKLLESPQIEVPPDFERYPPKVTDFIDRGQARISGSKTFEHLLIPRYPGLKVIQPLTFVYFDLGKREYVTLRSPQIELNVEQGTAPLSPLAGGGSREDVQVLSQDIRFIKITRPSFVRKGELPYASPLFLTLLVAPLLGFAGALVLARRRQALLQDQAGTRTRRAIKVAQRGLRQAEYLLHEKTGPKGEPSSIQRVRFYSEVSRALWKYLGDRLGIAQSDFSIDTAVQVLKNRSVEHGLIHAVRILLESCDMARFAPTSLELPAMQKTYDEAKRIIVELERALKS